MLVSGALDPRFLRLSMASQFEDDMDVGPEPPTEPSASALRASNLDREQTPEPDLDVNMTRGTHQVWLVKVPKLLCDGWRLWKEDDGRGR